MSAAVVVAGLLLVALPGLAAGAGWRLEPVRWVQWNYASVRLGMWSVQAGLLLAAGPLIAWLTGAHLVARCSRFIGPELPGGLVGASVAAVAAGAFAAARVALRRRYTHRQKAARIETWLGEHRHVSGADVAVVPTDRIIAYAASGTPPQVVLSEGMHGALDGDELEAVVRHELAHVRHRHHRHLGLAAEAEATLGWLSAVRRSVDVLRLSVERCADEEAATRTPSRHCVRRALVKVAAADTIPLPGFMAASTTKARIDALAEQPPPAALRDRLAVAVPPAVLSGVVLAGLVLWTATTDHPVLGLALPCALPI